MEGATDTTNITDDIFDAFDDLLDDGASQLAQKMLEIRPVEPEVVPTKIIIERVRAGTSHAVPHCPDSKNLVSKKVREAFAKEVIFPENEIFTSPNNTTDTMGGYLSGIMFDERLVTEAFETDEHVVSIRSNFMTLIYPGYSEPQKVKTSNRGRKKQDKKKKTHKKQGTGSEFNSQISFHVRRRVPGDDGYNPMQKPYKFKIFRTGQLQLPGANQATLEDVFWCLDLVQDRLRKALTIEIPKLESFSVVMKNYKFATKIPPGYILDLAALKAVLEKEQRTNHERSTPPIFMIKFDYEDSKLSILYKIPTARKPEKMLRVKIFMRGRINILGAIDERTSQICDHLYSIFGRNQTDIFAIEGDYNVALVDTIGQVRHRDILVRQDVLWINQTFTKAMSAQM